MIKSKLGLLTALAVIFNLFNANVNAKEKGENMSKNLVVYFSRTGEQYGVGNITEGNTAIVAKMIAKEVNADLFEIKVKNDTYPQAYKALTEAALSEKKANARPEIIGGVDNFAEYDTVFIGAPNWWADLPMPVYTFLEKYDWSNKTIAPFVTHEGSGLSSIPAKIKSAVAPKAMLDGMEMYGHVAQNSRDEALNKVQTWLKKIGF